MINVFKKNESFIHIEGDIGDLMSLSEYFSKYAPNYMFQPKFKNGFWDGKIRFFNMTSGNLPIGLFPMLEEAVEVYKIEANYDERILFDFEESPIDEDLWQEVLSEFSLFNPHTHQIEGARMLIARRKGLLEHATSSGKTVTLFLYLKYMLKRLQKYMSVLKIMIVVPTTGLLVQFKKDFELYGMDKNMLGTYFAEEHDLSKPITVGTWQSLKKAESFLPKVTIAIADEVHGAKALNVKELFEKCVSAKIKIGVTGSLPTEESDLLSIIGSFGEVLHEVHTGELIEKGIVSKVDVIQIHFHYPRGTQSLCKKDYKREKSIIQTSKERLELVSKLIGRHKDGENILLIFDELVFGQWYFSELQKLHPDRKFRYVAGDIDVNEREEIRQFTSNNPNVVIVGSMGTVSTGINIPRLHAIVGLWLGKSTIKLRQIIGRGLRLHESKTRCIFYDIADSLAYSKRHAVARLRVYFQEGFPVRSISVNN